MGGRTYRGELALLLTLFLTAAVASAGEIEPRAYVNTPVGVNFLLGGYLYSSGGLSTADASPLQDASLTVHTILVAYARSLDIFGASGKLDVIVPWSDLSGNANVGGTRRDRSVSGFNDPRFRFSVNYYGAPAMSVQEFPGYHQDLLLGASVQVTAPLGQYDKDKLVNLGNNRWAVKPDLGISKAWGDVIVELSTGVTFYTDNDQYYPGGSKVLEQNPVSTSQIHVTYSMNHGMWAALSGTYDYGGRTTTSGVINDDLQKNSRIGATFAMPVNRNNSVKLYGSTGVYTSRGNDYDLIGLVWQHRWGGGL